MSPMTAPAGMNQSKIRMLQKLAIGFQVGGFDCLCRHGRKIQDHGRTHKMVCRQMVQRKASVKNMRWCIHVGACMRKKGNPLLRIAILADGGHRLQDRMLGAGINRHAIENWVTQINDFHMVIDLPP